MTWSRGDVVLVPFQFTNQAGAKWRPAVVVSNQTYNQGLDVIIASITGNLRAIPHPGDHRLADWQQAGLLMPSLAQTKLATIEAALIGRKLGALSAHDMAAFDQGLREALALS